MKTMLTAAAAAMLMAMPAHAVTIFSDNFDDGDVSDWTYSTNDAGYGTEGMIADEQAPGDYRLKSAITIAGGDQFGLTARSSHDFISGAGDYRLTLSAESMGCQGCEVSYEILVDGGLLQRTIAIGHEDLVSIDLLGLGAGTHTLTLGMYTTRANYGDFNAHFDDVAIESIEDAVPEPASWAMMLAGFGVVGAGMRARRLSVRFG